MKNFSARIAVAGVALLPLVAFGGTTFYNDEASFLASLAPGNYADDFSSLTTGTIQSSYAINGGSDAASQPFLGSITSSLLPGAGNLYKGSTGLSTEFDGYALSYSLTSGNVQAVGGWFGIDDGTGTLVPGQLEFDLSDGTTVTLDVGPEATFVGFTTDSPTITGLNAFPIGSTLDNPLYTANSQLFVGVPETSTYAGAGFMALCVGGLWLRRARKAA